MIRSAKLASIAVAGLALSASTGAAQVMPDVMGTEEEARQFLEEMQSYVSENGIDAMIEALGNDDTRFGSSQHHAAVQRVNDEGRIFVEVHNYYAALSGVDFTDQQDLNGKYYMREFYEKAQNGGGTTNLMLEIPETEEAKNSWCITEWAEGYEGEYFLTSCY